MFYIYVEGYSFSRSFSTQRSHFEEHAVDGIEATVRMPQTDYCVVYTAKGHRKGT